MDQNFLTHNFISSFLSYFVVNRMKALIFIIQYMRFQTLVYPSKFHFKSLKANYFFIADIKPLLNPKQLLST
jgi:hypothetical protein